MQTVAINKSFLHKIIDRGGSLMGIYLDGETMQKRPSITGWSKVDKLPISTHDAVTDSMYYCYGFRPIDSGLWVLDLDKKKGKDGAASLAPLLGYPAWLDYPDQAETVYVDTPNGRHFYFLAEDMPEVMLNHAGSSFGKIEGVDIRYSRLGWIVAPGSIGYSYTTEKSEQYIAHGDKFARAPQELIDLLCSRSTSEVKEKKDAPKPVEPLPDYLKDYTGPTGLENIGDEDRDVYQELFETANAIEHNYDMLARAIPTLYPNAIWRDDRWHIGDIQGKTPAGRGSAFISTHSGCGDWSNDFHSDLIGMLCKARGIDRVASARLILSHARVADPTQKIVKEGEALKMPTSPEPINGNVKRYPLTQLGNSERLFARLGDKFIYNDTAKDWFYWNGATWEKDNKTRLPTLAIETIHDIPKETVLCTDPKEKSAVMAWYNASQNNNQINGMTTILSMKGSLHKVNDDFETHGALFNCGNGIIDLKTGNLTAHDPKRFFMRQSFINYNPNAKCPKFLRFLDQIMLSRQDIIKWLQVFFGYCLSGDVSEHVVAFFYGTGRNGKSALIDIARGIFSFKDDTGYFGAMRPESLMETKNGNTENHSLAAVHGCRLVVASESNPNSFMNVSRIKEIAGGDLITCRHLYGNYFKYIPTWKLVLLTNHKPKIPTQDEGTWRRIRCVPFDYTVSEDEADKTLAATILREEAEGVLAWFVAGAVEWYAHGMPKSDVIESFTNEYRASQDPLADFIEECCVISPNAHVQAKELFNEYKKFISERGEDSEHINQTWFGYKMRDRKGIEKDRSNNPGRRSIIYKGIGLKDSTHTTPPVRASGSLPLDADEPPF